MSSAVSISSSSSGSHSQSYNSDGSNSSRMSTPSKRGATGVAHAILSSVLPELREDMEDKISGVATVAEFVEHVWGIPASKIQSILAASWTLQEESLARYKSVAQSSIPEKELYAPFREMAIPLIADVYKHLNIQKEDSIDLWNGHGDQVIKTRYTTRKPDLLSMWIPLTSPPVWAAVQAVFEFKKAQVKKVAKEAAPGLASVSEVQPSSHSQDSVSVLEKKSAPRRSRRSTSNATASSLKRGKGAFDVSMSGPRTKIIPKKTDLPRIASSRNSSVSAASSGRSSVSKSKRKYAGNHDEQPAKYTRGVFYISLDELQLATYALECMADSLRHYATGIFINTYDLSLWYYDRIGVIRTKPIDFVKHPQNLALLLYALNECNHEKAGFSPFLIPRSPTDNLVDSPSSLLNMDVVLPLPNSRNNETRFTITAEQPLYRYRGLVGRGTMVYAVRYLPHDGPARENHVLKLNYPSIHRLLEGNLIVDIRNCVPELNKFLPDIVFHATYTTAALDLPRARFPPLEMPAGNTIEERQLHAIAMPRYEALWDARNLEEFKRIFIDLVECHYYVYENGRVLHRDLSENNLMFHRQGGETYGVLADWDLASELDNDGKVPVSKSRHRTGTVPFMAIDLLAKKPPPHLYRHDLESFFYILVWAAIHYDLGGAVGKRKLPLNKILEKWDSGDFESVRNAKFTFSNLTESALGVFSEVREEFKPLLDAWIRPLRSLFRKAYFTDPESLQEEAEYDLTTRGGVLTFGTFMNAINHKPHSLLELATR